MSSQEGTRLQKVLSQAGIASRRAAEDMIVAGRVNVNGKQVTRLGSRVLPTDVVEVDGERVQVSSEVIVIALNKPPGIVTSAEDELGRKTVYSLLPEVPALRAVGRLDMDTAGLLLCTNHGDLAHRLTHPSFQVEREYMAEVRGSPTKATLAELKRGVQLEDGLAKAKKIALIDQAPGKTLLSLVLTEGRNREVRRMLKEAGHEVLALGRTRVGPIKLGDLPAGRHRYLGPTETGALFTMVGL